MNCLKDNSLTNHEITSVLDAEKIGVITTVNRITQTCIKFHLRKDENRIIMHYIFIQNSGDICIME